MPRQTLIDFPHALHPIIARGLERKPIFLDKKDCEQFLSRFKKTFFQLPTEYYKNKTQPDNERTSGSKDFADTI